MKTALPTLAVALLVVTARAAEPAGGPQTALDDKQLQQMRLASQQIADTLAAVEARLQLLAEKVFRSRLVVRYEGEIDEDFRLEELALWLDDNPVYSQRLDKAPAVLSLQLYEGYLPPGPHSLRLELKARGPDAGSDGPAAQLAAAGMLVHLREKGVCRAVFEAELEGNSTAKLLQERRPQARWTVKIRSWFSTREDK